MNAKDASFWTGLLLLARFMFALFLAGVILSRRKQ